MALFRDWLSKKILRLVNMLEHHLFLPESKKIRVKEELSRLLKMREIYDEHQAQIAQEKWESLKDPTWDRFPTITLGKTIRPGKDEV